MTRDNSLAIDVKPLSEQDYPKFREMALNIWKKAYAESSEDFFDFFNLDYIDFNLSGPNKDDSKILGAYLKDTLVGSAGIIACNAMIKGKKHKVANITWYTSDNEARERIMAEENAGAIMHEQVAEDERIDSPENMRISFVLGTYGGIFCLEKNIDGVLGYYEENHPGYKAITRATDSAPGHVKNHNLKLSYPIAIVDGIQEAEQFIKHQKNTVEITEYKDRHLDDCLKLLNSYSEKFDFALYWSPEELSWQLDYPNVSETIIYRDAGETKALLNYIIVDAISGSSIDKFAIIDNVHIDYLGEGEKKHFLYHFLTRIREKAMKGAVYWHQNCFDESILYQVGFEKEQRPHHQCFHNFAVDKINLDGVRDTYFLFR